MAKQKQTTKTIEDVDELFRKDRGEGYVVRGSDIKSVGRIPVGHLSIDKALGGGIPRGRITEFYGKESSSKTLLTLSIIASAQKDGGKCVFIDTEKSFDPVWARLNGVDLESLRIVQPRNGEEAWEVTERYLATGEVDVIVFDSIASAVPNAELEGSIGQANIGLAARLNAQAMRTITSYFGDGDKKNNKTALLLINQERANVSTTPFAGAPSTTTGGRAIPYYASLRIELRKMGPVKVGEVVSGISYRLRVIKAKVTGIKPYSTALFDVDFDYGLDSAKDILNHAIMNKWIDKAGSWYTVKETEERRQGEAAMKEYLRESGLLDKWSKLLLTGEVEE